MAQTEDDLDDLLKKMSSSLPKDSKLPSSTAPDGKPSSLVSPSLSTKGFIKTSPSGVFPPSPMSLKSRKISSPGSTLSFLSATDHISSLHHSRLSDSASDISENTTPISTPQLGRKRTSSNSFEAEKISSEPLGGISRSSSTLSLCSNVSAATSGLPPLDRLLKHLRERLTGSLFAGWYTERRYVDAIDRYRDVILVDSIEALIIKQVKYALRKCRKILSENAFIGLTDENDESRLYINLGAGGLEASHPFGHYWFQIRAINFIPNIGFAFEIVVIRQFVTSDSETCWKCQSRAKEKDSAPPVKIDSIGAALFDMKSRFYEVSSEIVRELWQPQSYWSRIKPLLTVSNVINLAKLSMVVVLAMLTGIIAGVKQLANFSLRLLHELANLVDRSTPLALGALNIMSKVVGGAYLLVAMIWKDSVKKPPSSAQHQMRPQVGHQPIVRPSLPPPPEMPRPVHQRSNTREAMDNMYSQGRNW